MSESESIIHAIFRNQTDFQSGRRSFQGFLRRSVENKEYRWLLSGGSDGAVALYDLESAHRQNLLSNSTEHDTTSAAASFSIRHKSFAPAKYRHARMVSTVQWYPVDAGAFISSGYDGKIYLWDANAFEVVHEFATNNIVYRARFHSNGRWIGAALANGCVRICDCNSASASQTLTGHRMAVTSVQWDPINSFILASSSLDGNVMLWDIRKSGSQALLQQFDWRQDHTSVLQTICPLSSAEESFGHNLTRASSSLSQHMDHPGQFKTVNHGVNEAAKAHAGAVMSICYSSCGRYLLSSGNDRVVRMWLPDTGTLIPRSFEFGTHSTLPYDMEVLSLPVAIQSTRWHTPPEDFLVLPHSANVGDMSLNSINPNTHTRNKPTKVLSGHLGMVLSVCYRPASQQLISASKDGLILVWSPQADQPASHDAPDSAVADPAAGTRVSNVRVGAEYEVESENGLDGDCWSDDDDGRPVDLSAGFLPPIIRNYIADLHLAEETHPPTRQSTSTPASPTAAPRVSASAITMPASSSTAPLSAHSAQIFSSVSTTQTTHAALPDSVAARLARATNQIAAVGGFRRAIPTLVTTSSSSQGQITGSAVLVSTSGSAASVVSTGNQSAASASSSQTPNRPSNSKNKLSLREMYGRKIMRR